jgi:hypothetical protein
MEWSAKYRSEGTYEDEVKALYSLALTANVGIVELGVLFGDTSAVLCGAAGDLPVYGIDPIIPDSMNPYLIGDRERIRLVEKNYSNYTFIQDYSHNVIRTFNKSFDVIFIDADHNFEAVRRDFMEWYPYLVKNGYMAFHDSAANRGGPKEWPGPSELTDRIILSGLMEYIKTVCSLTIFIK